MTESKVKLKEACTSEAINRAREGIELGRLFYEKNRDRFDKGMLSFVSEVRVYYSEYREGLYLFIECANDDEADRLIDYYASFFCDKCSISTKYRPGDQGRSDNSAKIELSWDPPLKIDKIRIGAIWIIIKHSLNTFKADDNKCI